jgi:PAS domain S-box-containing protein
VQTSLAAEPLLALAVTVTSEQRVDSVLQSIVRGLASQPGVALARIWLLPSAGLPSFCHAVSDLPNDLCLVASAGAPINSPGEDWRFLQGHFARMAFNVGKVGEVAATRHPILVEDVTTQNDWIVRPEWAKREEIRSFGGYPLIFRDKLLGVIAVFSRHPLAPQQFTWLGLFANQAALAISNACAEEALRSSEHNLGAIIDALPTLAWCNLPDGSNEFLNKGWHEYTGLSPEESHGWGWQVAFHPEDLPPLIEKWQKMLISGESDEIEARLRRHDGVYRWFLIRAQALRNESGEIVRWYGTSTDIEDLKQAQGAWRASERKLGSIINTIPTAAWTTRPDGYCDFLNQVWLDYAGMSSEQAQGWSWIEAIHPDDREKLVNDWQSCLASGTPFDTEARIRRFDSSFRWFLIRGNPLKDESGNILKWYGTCVDIDGRKRGEEALRARELSWRQIVDNVPGFVATTSGLGDVEFLNRQTLEYFGKTTEELKDWALIDAVHPDDLPRVIEARKRSIEAGQIYEVEHRCRRADGVYRWFQVRGLPVRDAENKVTAWYLLLTDIDDRKNAEAQIEQAYLRLAEAQRVSKTGSFITDLTADHHDWSEETFRIFEFDPASRVTVKKIRDIIHPEDVASFDAMIARAMTGADVDFGFRILTSRGGVKYIRGMARTLIQNTDRRLFIGALQDVTDSKIAEEALSKARSELADVARITTLNALTASVAHEINQPLASLVTNASICLRRLNADPPNIDGARERVQRAISDATRASDVITRLRALYGKKELTLEPLDLNEATREVIALFSDDLQRARVLLLTEFEAGLPAVRGDRVQLQQVILNLLRNASEAMSTINDRVRELLVRTEREEVDRVRLSVKDAGVGLEPQAAERLFRPFYTTKSSGMGIGLSISRSIIEAHQGRLWAASNAGPGTTFSFSIPTGQGGQARPSEYCFAIGFISNGDELSWMSEVQKILQDEFPNLNLTTSAQYSPLLAEALSNEQIDAAFLRREEGWPDLAYETVLRIPLVVYLPARHRLAAFQEISPQDLVGETFATAAKTAPVLRRAIDDYLERSGVNITPTDEIDHPGQAVSLVSAGAVLIFPRYLQNFLPDSATMRPFKGDPPTIDLVLGYKKSNESPILKFLISRLDDLAARVTKKEAEEPSDATD